MSRHFFSDYRDGMITCHIHTCTCVSIQSKFMKSQMSHFRCPMKNNTFDRGTGNQSFFLVELGAHVIFVHKKCFTFFRHYWKTDCVPSMHFPHVESNPVMKG